MLNNVDQGRLSICGRRGLLDEEAGGLGGEPGDVGRVSGLAEEGCKNVSSECEFDNLHGLWLAGNGNDEV
ncbi:hypothetical protein HYQ46_011834 [Verticillium longisporum]|nr:hypothetical protein HYQ46_011834 [Verticillium longisporum]